MKLLQKLALGSIRLKLGVLSVLAPKLAARSAFNLFCTPQLRTRRALPAILLKAEQLKDQFQGIPVNGYRVGGGQGRTVLIVHGFESSAVNYHHYFEVFASKGYTVIAFDAPAHGTSGGKQINALLYRDFILFVTQRYGPFDALMGHSLGGLALMMAVAGMADNAKLRIALIAPVTETATVVRIFLDAVRITRTKTRAAFRQIITDLSGQPMEWFSIGRTLETTRSEIRWFHDQQDQVTPIADALVVRDQNHPGVKFVITSGLGHRRIYRDPAVSGAIVDFL